MRVTFTTDSRRRPAMPTLGRMFPGDRACRRLVVIGTTRTVEIRLALKTLP